MKKKDIEKELRSLGYWYSGGSKHDKWINKRGATIIVPRHREINEFTARGILRDAKRGAGK